MPSEGDRVNFWWAVFFLSVLVIGPVLMLVSEVREWRARVRWRKRLEEKRIRERGLV